MLRSPPFDIADYLDGPESIALYLAEALRPENPTLITRAIKATARANDTRNAERSEPDFERQARRKLLLLDGAAKLDDLRQPPGNRLEALKGDRRGQYSIRINDQWRICFEWREDGAELVEIVDYH